MQTMHTFTVIAGVNATIAVDAKAGNEVVGEGATPAPSGSCVVVVSATVFLSVIALPSLL
jgi:hypothetical protein